jgi:low temperature requirement protein LtrA
MKPQFPATNSFLAGEDQPVSFAELFFDLVFVFCVTQVVHLLDNSFDLLHIGRAILVFWLVWWAWTQFTWALNAADTKHMRIELATLLATACAFFMAVTAPQSFASCSWWFAGAYVAVRSIGLLIYLWVVWGHEEMRSAVKTFAAVSIAGLVAVIAGGLLGGTAQYWCWGLAIVLDVVAATIGGENEGWNLHPKHFAERHGLFVIIALGETLIVAASAASEEPWALDLILVSALSVGITSSLWWLYFYRIKDHLEHAIAHHTGSNQSTMARDVFSLFHFPMICGLIIYAYAIEEAMLNPSSPMSVEGRVALATGIFLYSISLVIAYWRATGKVLLLRSGMTILLSGICLGYASPGVLWTLLICFSGLILLAVIEMEKEKEIA